MHRRATICILLLIFASKSWGRDYFVSPRGNDAADGLTAATAKHSFAAVTANLRPGDVMRLQRGGTWRETLRLPSGEPHRPIRVTAYGGGELPTIDGSAINQPALAICIDASASYIIIDSLRVTGAAALDRGAIMVWANTDLAGITISHCQITGNAGRGIWVAGDAGKSVKWLYIDQNEITANAGCGIAITKADAGWITDNVLTQNCQKTVDAWQAAVRLWSGDVRNVLVADNEIDNGIHHLERGAGMGVHVDETGAGVTVAGNDIRHCDAAGVEVENTRGVSVSDNVMFDVHAGVQVYRAGHDHRITYNTILARSQGIVLQGMLAHGIDAGPEVLVEGQLITSNLIEHNIALAEQWGSLKLIGGGELLTGTRANIVRANAFGPERPGLIEWGDGRFNSYDDLPAHQITDSCRENIAFVDRSSGDLHTATTMVDLGAKHFREIPSKD